MSKSSGNAFNPLDLVDEFGADALRYFLIREMNVGQDGDFSRELFLARYNSDLANDLGNLVNRVLNMTGPIRGRRRSRGGRRRRGRRRSSARLWEATVPDYIALFEGFQFHTGLERLFAFVTSINGYIEKRAPWKLGKSAEPGRPGAPRDLARDDGRGAAAGGGRPCARSCPGAREKINGVLGYTPGRALGGGARLGRPAPRLQGRRGARPLPPAGPRRAKAP